MSKGPRNVPQIEANVDIDGALARTQDRQREILGFERGEFGNFFGLQDELGGALRQSIQPFGELPPALREAFQQNTRSAQSARGLATSPISARSEALGLAGLAPQIFGATTGAAQNFLNSFRADTGFSPSSSQLFGEDISRQRRANAAQNAQANFRQAAQTERADQRAEAVSGLLGMAGSFFGPAGAALGQAAGGLIGNRIGGGGGTSFQSAAAGGLLGQSFQQQNPLQVAQQGGGGQGGMISVGGQLGSLPPTNQSALNIGGVPGGSGGIMSLLGLG